MHKDIEVTDPRGFVVRCYGDYWQKTILRKHPELANYHEQVQQALESPQYGCIFRDRKYPNRQIYYGELRNRVEIKVVVQFDSPNEGTVVSASPCSRRPDGEILLWHK